MRPRRTGAPGGNEGRPEDQIHGLARWGLIDRHRAPSLPASRTGHRRRAGRASWARWARSGKARCPGTQSGSGLCPANPAATRPSATTCSWSVDWAGGRSLGISRTAARRPSLRCRDHVRPSLGKLGLILDAMRPWPLYGEGSGRLGEAGMAPAYTCMAYPRVPAARTRSALSAACLKGLLTIGEVGIADLPLS